MKCSNPECRHDDKSHDAKGRCGVVTMHGSIIGVLCNCLEFKKPKKKMILNKVATLG